MNRLCLRANWQTRCWSPYCLGSSFQLSTVGNYVRSTKYMKMDKRSIASASWRDLQDTPKAWEGRQEPSSLGGPTLPYLFSLNIILTQRLIPLPTPGLATDWEIMMEGPPSARRPLFVSDGRSRMGGRWEPSAQGGLILPFTLTHIHSHTHSSSAQPPEPIQVEQSSIIQPSGLADGVLLIGDLPTGPSYTAPPTLGR